MSLRQLCFALLWTSCCCLLGTPLLPSATAQLGGDATAEDRADEEAEDGANAPNAPAKPQSAVIIKLEGMITPLSGALLMRKFEQARDRGVDTIVIHIDSPGGFLSTTMQMVNMLERAKDVETVAYVEHQAISGAAMTALATDKIVMQPGATLGDAGLIFAGEDSAFRYAPEKARSALVQQIRAIALTAGRPPALAEAMVDKDISVVEATHAETGERRFFTNHEWEALADQDAWGDPRPVVEAKENTFLTVNGRRAVELGLADATVENEQALAAELNIDGPIVRLENSKIDTMVVILNNPWVTGLLIFIGLLALLFELSAPGIGIGGLLSIFCFGVFFWSRFLGGTAGWLEVILFVMGLIFIGMEFFVIPGFGVAGLGGIAMLVSSLVMASRHVMLPENQQDLQQLGTTFSTVLLAILAFLIAAFFLSQYVERIPGLSRLALQPPTMSDAQTGLPVSASSELPPWETVAVGDLGRALSSLRPSGKALFGEAIVDVSTEGDFVDADETVRVLKRQGTRLVVRKAENP